MFGVQLKNFNTVRFQGNSQLNQRNSVNLQSRPAKDTVSFKGAGVNLETLEELAGKKGELKKYFETAQAIAEHIQQLTAKTLDYAENRTKESINPFYDRIKADGSLGLRMYYGSPSSLLTPLGQMQINGSTGHIGNQQKKLMEELKETLGLKEILPGVQDEMGYNGPIYAITKDLSGNPLPELSPEGLTQRFMGNYSHVNDYEAQNKLESEVCPQRK